MVKYLLASHGRFAEGTASFLKIMVGATDNIYTLSAFLDDRSVDAAVAQALQQVGTFDQLLVFCDIHGGSVAQEVFRQTHDDTRDIQVIAGYNLALVMELMMKGRPVTPDEIRAAVQASRSAIVYLNDVSKPKAEEDALF